MILILFCACAMATWLAASPGVTRAQLICTPFFVTGVFTVMLLVLGII